MAAESVICDTDVMIDYLDGSKSRHQSVKTIVEKSIGIEQLMISAITKMELIRGVKDFKFISDLHLYQH